MFNILSSFFKTLSFLNSFLDGPLIKAILALHHAQRYNLDNLSQWNGKYILQGMVGALARVALLDEH